jgi:hypothetical protein
MCKEDMSTSYRIFDRDTVPRATPAIITRAIRGMEMMVTTRSSGLQSNLGQTARTEYVSPTACFDLMVSGAGSTCWQRPKADTGLNTQHIGNGLRIVCFKTMNYAY